MHAKEASFKTGSATAAAKTAAPLILFRSGEAGIGNVLRDAIQIFGNRRLRRLAPIPNLMMSNEAWEWQRVRDLSSFCE